MNKPITRTTGLLIALGLFLFTIALAYLRTGALGSTDLIAAIVLPIVWYIGILLRTNRRA